MSVTRAFKRALNMIKKRGWDKIYVAVDIHETMMKPTWSKERSTVYYDYCQTVLRHLSKREDVCLILWSSSSPENNLKYQKEFANLGINFEHINSNPEVPSTDYADFDSKFYVNVIIDDKAGFDPETEWLELLIMFELSNKN